MSQAIATTSPTPEPVSPLHEARAFERMRFRVVSTVLRQSLSQARFRISLVIGLSALLWGGMFWMFADGFWELQLAIAPTETYGRTVGAMFGTFFAALFLMLVFSSGIILYSTLFWSREVGFLLTLPAHTQRVFLHKFQEAIVLSSWGFVLLGSPILVAYGVVERAPWYYYAMLLPYLVAFIYIPVAIGAIICLWVVQRIPDSRLAVLVTGAVILLAAAAWIAWSLLNGSESKLLTSEWFQDIVGRLQFSERRLLPSWWFSQGLLDAAAGAWSESLLFFTLMVSNAMFFRQLALWSAGWMYRKAYSGLCDRSARRRRLHAAGFDRMLGGALRFLPAPARLMIVKDLRLFRRDPMQWSQFLIFLGLLALYFFNIRHFTYDIHYIGWVNMVSFLNLSVVGLLFSTFTSRFIFPMISLEGRRFWILGLLGVDRDTILWSKFLFATVGSIIPCTLLVLLSDAMLSVSTFVVLSHQMTCLVLCVGLSGIAVGLGARLPNLREQSPSRIAAGFGGTLNLVISTLYILVVVLMTALPTHFYLTTQHGFFENATVDRAGVLGWLHFWLVAGIIGSLILGVIATIVPLRIGLRAFRKMEF
jgi:ABC-2 type transport system permease protein